MNSLEIVRDLSKEREFNLKMRLFLSMAAASDTLGTYYDYIYEKDFPKIVDLISPSAPHTPPSKVTP
jgi:hypothetical protein